MPVTTYFGTSVLGVLAVYGCSFCMALLPTMQTLRKCHVGDTGNDKFNIADKETLGN